ncbi:helix-turn-helix domain-containing protein [Sporosarcina sp. ACRSL]|uniref:helix-turn-helix domain-containing protein n=1 Tax=Sporosarcina sp. ACRSL TaxID=2918215 RepID=UPI001EF41354|nr:helix-turn-helix transcriptional regulator [Sporosarcina sp. ACRSL]MCG7343439.1 helix-turn-helix domain-containing protein [Sporosarcina sp. ACRSL]
MNIGSILKYYRMKNNLTQAELSEGICSISHLSKIESNKYVPHIETINELFNRMNIEWEQEVNSYEYWKEKLETFIMHSVYYDLTSMEEVYAELSAQEDYLQSTDLVNRYELYKLRYYLFKRDIPRATQQTAILKRMEKSFTDYEKGVSKVIYLMYDIFTQNFTEAEGRLERIEEFRERIPHMFEGELFYQRAYLLHNRAQYSKSTYYAEMAVDHFRKDSNYIRLLHAQLLLAINYTKRDFTLQAEGLFKTILRNAKMMEKDQLYQGALYNYSVLQNRRGLHSSAYDMLKELKALLEAGTDYYQAVLIHLLQTAVEENKEIDLLLDELEELAGRKKDPYLEVQLEYFRKTKLSQQELFDYCEQIVFPFLKKHDYIGEARSIAYRLANYYRSTGNDGKADMYSLYYYDKGEKES